MATSSRLIGRPVRCSTTGSGRSTAHKDDRVAVQDAVGLILIKTRLRADLLTGQAWRPVCWRSIRGFPKAGFARGGGGLISRRGTTRPVNLVRSGVCHNTRCLQPRFRADPFFSSPQRQSRPGWYTNPLVRGLESRVASARAWIEREEAYRRSEFHHVQGVDAGYCGRSVRDGTESAPSRFPRCSRLPRHRTARLRCDGDAETAVAAIDALDTSVHGGPDGRESR